MPVFHAIADAFRSARFADAAEEQQMASAIDTDVEAYLSNRRTQFTHWFFLTRLSLVLGFLLYAGVNLALGEAVAAPVLLALGAYLVANAAAYFALGSEAETTPWAFAALDAATVIGLRYAFTVEVFVDPNATMVAAFALLLISYTLYGDPKLSTVLALVALVASSLTLMYAPADAGGHLSASKAEPLRFFLMVEYLSVACLVTCILALRLRRQVVAYSIELHRRMEAAVREATERAHRERIEKLDHLKRDFIDTLSHELRNPIATLHPSLAFVRAEMEDGRCEIDTLDIAMESAEMLERLIKDYAHLAELLTQDEPGPRRNVHLDALLHALIQSEHRSHFDLDAVAGRAVAGTPQLLRGALLAVLRRAELLTPEGQPITVRCFEDEHAVVVTVHDPASCLSPGILGALDDPFALTDERRFYSNNTGLELVLAQHALRRLGGRLGINDDPDAPAGTTVCCYLPPAEDDLPWLRTEQLEMDLAVVGW